MNIKNILKNEEILNNIIEDITEIPEDTPVTYEVWAIGYDSYGKVTDAELFTKKFTDPDEAINHAKQLTLADILQQAATDLDNIETLAEVAYISVEVETVVDDEECGSMNIGTIYKEELWICN